MKNSAHNIIEKRINAFGKGSVFMAFDFTDIANGFTVSKIFFRLMDKNKIEKVMRGVYWLPDDTGIPSPNNVANALARSHMDSVIPCGDTALYTMGLSKNIPENNTWTYVTNGFYQEYHYSDITIRFQHTAGRFISKMSERSALIVQVLKAYGQNNLSEDILTRIQNKLSHDDIHVLIDETKNTTEWIAKTIRSICLKLKAFQ